MRKMYWDDRYNGRPMPVFVPALTPFEAAMLPAGERPDRAALHQLRAQADWQKRFDKMDAQRRNPHQRTNIWVR